MALLEIVTREERLAARTALLADEKARTRARDQLNAARRRLQNWLDLTPLGRQEDWEEPSDRSDRRLPPDPGITADR